MEAVNATRKVTRFDSSDLRGIRLMEKVYHILRANDILTLPPWQNFFEFAALSFCFFIA